MQKRINLRLLMITELFLPTKGGTATSFDDDFRRLGGKDVHILTADVPGAAEFDRNHPNTIHRISLKRHEWLKPESLFIYGKLLLWSFWITITKGITAIYAGRALPEGLVALVVARLTRRPVFIYAHGEELTGWGRGRKFQAMCFVLRRSDRVLSNSDNTRDILMSTLGVGEDRIEVVYPTVDHSRFKPLEIASDFRESIGVVNGKKLVLSVGRLIRRKGFDNVIRSLPSLLKAGLDVEYAVIGRGDDIGYLREVAIQCGVEARVHFLDSVSYEDLPGWYHACDVFAMPNRDIDGDTEGFGLVFLEAAAAGKAVVAGKAGGTASAVVDGVTGLRVDGEDVGEIGRALAELLGDPARADRLGRNARERVLREFTHERRVQQLRDLAMTRLRR